MDSVITAQGIAFDKQSIELEGAKSSIDNYKGIATGNQNELINKVNQLSEENKNLTNKVNSLIKERDKLKNQLKELENKEIE